LIVLAVGAQRQITPALAVRGCDATGEPLGDAIVQALTNDREKVRIRKGSKKALLAPALPDEQQRTVFTQSTGCHGQYRPTCSAGSVSCRTGSRRSTCHATPKARTMARYARRRWYWNLGVTNAVGSAWRETRRRSGRRQTRFCMARGKTRSGSGQLSMTLTWRSSTTCRPATQRSRDLREAVLTWVYHHLDPVVRT